MKLSVSATAIVTAAIALDAVSAFSSPRVGPTLVRYVARL